MRLRRSVRVLKWLCGAVVVGLGLLALVNWREAVRRSRPLDQPYLQAEEKVHIAEALRLKRALGDRVWPGFAAADLPLILYNDRHEFLVGFDNPPEPWAAVAGDQFEGKHYFRRVAVKPQAFAVPVGGRWAGSAGTLGRLNRDYLHGARQQLPLVLAQLFPYWFATVPQDLHVVLLLHEAFHAHQATAAPAHFAATRPYDRRQPGYPAGNPAFASAWDHEGSALAQALRAPDRDSALRLAREFLRRRDERRAQAALSNHLREYERQMEWLEGLAKYVEIRFYELAAREPPASHIRYRSKPPYWTMDFYRIENRLGRQHGDQRFYLSGMAQARLLDLVLPGWQRRALEGETSPEDLLRSAAAAP